MHFQLFIIKFSYNETDFLDDHCSLYGLLD